MHKPNGYDNPLTDNTLTLGNKIRDKRKSKNLTQAQLGALLGVQASAVSKYEKGIVTNIPYNIILRLVQVLDLNADDFINFTAEGYEEELDNLQAAAEKRAVDSVNTYLLMGEAAPPVKQYENFTIINHLAITEEKYKSIADYIAYILNLPR